MAKHTHTTTDAPSSPLQPVTLPSLTDAFAVRRQMFGPAPPADEQPDIWRGVFQSGRAPHALGGWTLACIAVATVALEWLARVI